MQDRIVRLKDGSITTRVINEDVVRYELRFRPGDYVQDLNPEKEYDKFTGTVGKFEPPYGIPKEEYKECMRVVAIPANIMAQIHDYTVNRMDSRGKWSTSSTAADSDLVSASKEEIRIWSEKMRKGWNERYPDHQIVESLSV